MYIECEVLYLTPSTWSILAVLWCPGQAPTPRWAPYDSSTCLTPALFLLSIWNVLLGLGFGPFPLTVSVPGGGILCTQDAYSVVAAVPILATSCAIPSITAVCIRLLVLPLDGMHTFLGGLCFRKFSTVSVLWASCTARASVRSGSANSFFRMYLSQMLHTNWSLSVLSSASP